MTNEEAYLITPTHEPDVPLPPLPDDVQRLFDFFRQPPTGKTVMLMGCVVTLPPAIVGEPEKTPEQEAIESHVARWGRFERRWRNHRIFGLYAADMRIWEARKAGIRVLVEDPNFGLVTLAEPKEWFFALNPQMRMSLVKDMTEQRMDERRNKLAKRRLRQLSQPTYYTDAATSLRSA